MSTKEIHELTNTTPLNLRLHERALRIWDKIEIHNNLTYTRLRSDLENINKFNRNFTSSLTATYPNPQYH